MAYDWEHVEAIRAAQESARERFNQDVIAGDSMAADIRNSPGGKETDVRDLDSWDVRLFKLKAQLIDYIIEHGLVQGFNWDDTDYPIQGGKIVVTEEMVKMVTDRFGYFTEKETLAFIEKYLPEHDYVSDSHYVHTDNNYTTEEKEKLDRIETGAQVNAILDVIFNGSTVLDPKTKVATITITPETVKEWYESNENTNAFTDTDKEKLDGIDVDALSNKVEDVTLDGETVVKDKVAVLTAKKIKDSYESNPDTNAFTDADKSLVENVLPEVVKGVNQHERRLDDLEDFETEQKKKNEAFSAKDAEQDGRLDALEAKNAAQDKEITEAKASISELGNEVNSIGGRVTTNETDIKALKESQASQDEDISQLQEDVNSINQKDTAQDAEIEQLKKDVADAGKVDDVQVDGTSVVVDKIAQIPKVYTEDEISTIVRSSGYELFVPYENATRDVNLSGQRLMTGVNPSALTGFGTLSNMDGSNSGIIVYNQDQSSLYEAYGINVTDVASDHVYANILIGAYHKQDDGSYRKDTLKIGLGTATGGFDFIDVVTTHGGTRKLFVLRGIEDPVDSNDAATKKYVDDSVDGITKFVPYRGATGDVSLNKHKLIQVTGIDLVQSSGNGYGEIYPNRIGVGTPLPSSGSALKASLYTTSQTSSGRGELMLRDAMEGVRAILTPKASSTDEGKDIKLRAIAVETVGAEESRRLARLAVATPTEDEDSVTKKYVDDKILAMQAVIDELTTRITALESK